MCASTNKAQTHQSCISWKEDRENAILTNPSGNELCILASIIKNQAYRVMIEDDIRLELRLLGGAGSVGGRHRLN